MRSRAAATQPPDDRLATGLIAACSALILLRALAAFTPINWLWGVNTWRYWGVPGAVVVALLAAAGLLPPVARALETSLARIGNAWARVPAAGDALAGACVAALTWSLRDPVQFTGDFDLRVSVLDTNLDLAKLFPQAFPLDALLNLSFARELVRQGASPDDALHGIGAAMAFAFTIGAARFARGLGGAPGEAGSGPVLPAVVIVLAAGGWMPHFAGYEKYGPLLAGLAFAASGFVRMTAGRGGEWELALGTLVCAGTHRAGLAIVPASLLAFALAWRAAGHPAKPGPPRRGAILGAGLVTLAGVAALAPLAWHVLTTVDRSVHLPGGEVARSFETRGEADSLVRVADTLNVLLFLAPVWPVGLVAWIVARGAKPARPNRARALPVALAIAAQLALLLVIRATRGGGRDWDASTVPALTVALASAGALAVAWPRARRTIAPVVTLALAGAATSWALHAVPAMNLARIRTQLEATPAWSATAQSFAHDQLGVYSMAHATPAEAARHFEQAFVLAPNPRYAWQAGLAHEAAGDPAAARGAFRQVIARNPALADPWSALARLALAEGDTLAAGALADSALRRKPNHAEAAAIRARTQRGATGR